MCPKSHKETQKQKSNNRTLHPYFPRVMDRRSGCPTSVPDPARPALLRQWNVRGPSFTSNCIPSRSGNFRYPNSGTSPPVPSPDLRGPWREVGRTSRPGTSSGLPPPFPSCFLVRTLPFLLTRGRPPTCVWPGPEPTVPHGWNRDSYDVTSHVLRASISSSLRSHGSRRPLSPFRRTQPYLCPHTLSGRPPVTETHRERERSGAHTHVLRLTRVRTHADPGTEPALTPTHPPPHRVVFMTYNSERLRH